jgi:RHS repeat-associated protein
MAYDAAGRLTSQTDASGKIINTSYDADNRKTLVTWVASGSTVNLQTFTYDANSNELTAADYNGAYTMSYDALNRATVTKEPFGVVLTATYDAAGNRTTVQDSLGGTTTFVFDNLHNLTSEQFGGSGQTPLRIDLAYDPRNLVTTITRYSDLAGTTKIGSTLQGYDALGRLASQQDRNSSDANIANYTNTYDAASRMTSEQVNGAAPTTYTYDNTNELTNDGTTTYTYDLNGNRTMAGYTTGAGNQLVSQGAWSYSYDLNGNLISKTQSPSVDTWTNIYDHLNRLVGVQDRTNPGGTLLTAVTYVYDVMGNRIEEDTWTSGSGGTTARFAYDGQNAFADLNGSNTLTMRRLYMNGVDQLFARIDSGGGASWYLTDHLGSVCGILNATGTSQATVTYDGFGNVASNSNNAATDRYLYTAREYDSATQLQYNRSRYYDAGAGRWISEDPLRFSAGDSNLTRYSKNNPINSTDPIGQMALGTFGLTTGDVHRGANGAYSWGAHFLPPARSNGFILQTITVYYSTIYSTGITEHDYEKFVEAWQVTNGKVTGGGVRHFVPGITEDCGDYDDYWSRDAIPSPASSVLAIGENVTGEAFYYRGMTLQDISTVHSGSSHGLGLKPDGAASSGIHQYSRDITLDNGRAYTQDLADLKANATYIGPPQQADTRYMDVWWYPQSTSTWVTSTTIPESTYYK